MSDRLSPASREKRGIVLLEPGQGCGEVCDAGAAVELDGGYLYCWECLARLVRLGTVFDAAMAEARDA